jgi:hypothetical protein
MRSLWKLSLGIGKDDSESDGDVVTKLVDTNDGETIAFPESRLNLYVGRKQVTLLVNIVKNKNKIKQISAKHQFHITIINDRSILNPSFVRRYVRGLFAVVDLLLTKRNNRTGMLTLYNYQTSKSNQSYINWTDIFHSQNHFSTTILYQQRAKSN